MPFLPHLQRHLQRRFCQTLYAHLGRVEFVVHRGSKSEQQSSNPRLSSSSSSMGGYTVGNIKKAYGIPADLKASNANSLQMVWGPGTFGYSIRQLQAFKDQQCPQLDMEKVKFDTGNHGHVGDNYMEGNLDTQMISSFGLGVTTLVSNTNTSASTEEGEGFGQAMLDFLTELPSRSTLPQVLSLSLGSLSAYSCDLLISEGIKAGHTEKEIREFLQSQRQVCMFLNRDQVRRINTAFQLLGLRGVSVFGSSGDGGSHFSFQPFSGGAIADTLNKISCAYAIPVFPTTSPYITSVGGTAWSGVLFKDSSKPIAWSGSGGGFSWEFGAPSHQKEAVSAYLQGTSDLPPSSSFNASGRAYPDISAVAVEGTSQSSPMVAGIFSLVMDHRLNAGLPPLGFLGPRLYQVMARSPGEAFESVTSGNTKTSCETGFPAGQGWDPVTGWGRPKWPGLLAHFGSDEATAVNIAV
ncbi:unnamed protein product [Prorocentrum cordatum]|uniref:subtilisin n=1 Tax=Prorocentrum cordatum TaxID=2364126 RepID=A0ABN9YBS6_9DINO|nr:unnamed protein product [Polarella glacialis]